MWRRSEDKTHTDDNGVVWTNTGTTYLHQGKDGSGIYFSQSKNANGELTLSSHRLSKNEMAVFGLYHSEKAMMAAIEYHLNPTMGNLLSTLGKELVAQWTTPELLVSGATIGITTIQTMSKMSPQYTVRVRTRAMQDPVSHDFPYSFDKTILSTKPKKLPSGYKIYQLHGTMNNKQGIFEIGVNQKGIIDHRFFRPSK